MKSIEWLAKQLEDYGDPGFCELEWKDLDKLVEQAKEIRKHEIMEAYKKGREDSHLDYYPDKHAEEYYNEVFKKD